jgi:hypothetical protein
VRVGYPKWVAGEIESERWPALAEKFDARYSVSRNTKQRSRAKARGAASAMLISYFDARASVVRFVLQVSDGEHAAHEIERLQDATTREGRIEIHAMGYELVRLDSKWTWRMTDEHRSHWRNRIRHAASHPDREQAGMLARQIIYSLSRVPGFRGLRKDSFALRGVLLQEWRRLRTKDDLKLLPPRPWPRISYCRRLASR